MATKDVRCLRSRAALVKRKTRRGSESCRNLTSAASEGVTDTDIRSCILELVEKRGLTKTACPSEVARALSKNNWRNLMDRVRLISFNLADDGKIEISQKGKTLQNYRSKIIRGPIRIRAARLQCSMILSISTEKAAKPAHPVHIPRGPVL